MYLSGFLRRVRGIFESLFARPHSASRSLRLVQLEDRRVLNASVAVNAGIVLSGAETLTIENGGTADLGGGNVQTVLLTLDNASTWNVAGLDANDFDINGNELLVDASLFQDGGDLLGAGNELVIQGTIAGTDRLVLDLTGIDFIPTGGISFLGGEHPGNADNDTLAVVGYNIAVDADPLTADLTLNHTGPESGNITLTGLGTVTFAEIEPLLLGGTAADLVINLPGVVDNNVVLSDDGNVANGISRIDGDSFELTDFANPTSSLTINDPAGVKLIFVRGLDPAFDSDVTLNDTGSDNAVTFDTADTDLGTGDLTVNADTISITRAITTEGGTVTLNADTLVSSTAAGDVRTTAAPSSGVASGAIDINVSGTGTVDLLGDLVTEGADHAAGNGSDGGAVTIDTVNGTIAAARIRTDGGDDLANANTGGVAGLITINTGNANQITLRGDLFAAGGAGGTVGAGSDVTLSDAVLLANDITIGTGATAGNILFSSTVNGTVAGSEDLSLTAGTGNVTFTGAVGGGTRLGIVTVNSAANVTIAAMTVASLNQIAGSGLTTLGGAINANTAAGISIAGTNVAINNTVTTTNAGVVTVNVTGTATIAAAGDINSDGAVSITATGGISTAGDITTTNDDVTYVSAVTLTGDVAINTGAGAGSVRFNSTLDGTAAGTEDLTITAGTGNVVFTGAVGGGTRLGIVAINSATNVTTAAMTVASLNQTAGSGLTTLGGAINTNTAAGVSIAGTNVAINNTVTTTNAGVVTVNVTGTATIAAAGDIDSDGVVSITATGGISTAGNITTTNDNVTFVSAVTLTGDIAINTGAGAGSVSFNSTLNGTAAGTEDLTIAAGTGSVTFTGAVGGGIRLGIVTINSATNVNTAAMTVASLNQTAGSGLTTLGGAINTNTAAGVSITGTNVAINNTVTTTNAGVVTVNVTGTATIAAAGDINSDGAVSITANGGITTAGDIDTTDDNITINSAVTLTGSIDYDTTGAAAGNIRFISTIATAANNVNLDAGVAGNVTLDANVTGGGNFVVRNGAIQNFSGLSVASVDIQNSSTSVTFNGPVTVTANNANGGTDALKVNAAGTVTVSGAITATAAAGLNLDIDPTDVAINADMTATGQIDITASNNITIAAVTVRSDTDGNGGALSITADDDNSGAGDLTAVDGSVLRGHTVTLTGFNTVTDVVTSNVGTLTIIARNDVTINDATTATAGQVTVSARRDIIINANITASTIAQLIADSDASATGAISRTAGTVQGASVILNAAQGIGTAAAIVTQAGQLTATNSTSGEIRISEAFAGGDVTLNAISNGNRDVFLDTANGSFIDGNGGLTNITAGNATITAVNGSIGATSADVFLGTFDPVEVNLTGNLVATALTGAVAFSGTIGGTTTVNAITGFIQSAGNLDVSGAAFTVTNLALITAATLTVADAGLTVAGDLRIEAANVEAVTANNPVILGTAGSPVDRLLYRVTTANDEVVIVRTGDLDVETGTSVQLELRQNVQFTDLDRDLTSLDTNGATAILNSVGAAVTQGNSTGTVAGVQSNDRMLSQSLLLVGDGPFTLTNSNNNITTLAASSNGAISFRDTNTLTVGTVSQLFPVVAVAGVQTLAGNSAISIVVDAGDLTISQVVTADGSGNVTLTAGGSVLLGAVVSSTSGNLTITADADTNNTGAIVDTLPDTDGGTAGEQGVNLVTTGTAFLSAAEGIGSADDIDTTIGILQATNTTSNSISIQETNILTIGGTGVRTLGGNGQITVDVVAGDLTVSSVVSANGAGFVVLLSNETINLGATVSSTTGALFVIADADANGTGAIIDTMADTDLGTPGEQGVNLSTGGTAILSAGAGIGHADDIDTTIDTLIASNLSTGDISVQETNGLVIGGTGVRTQGGNGNIRVNVTVGDLSVGSVVTADGFGTVTLTAGGSIFLGDVVSSTTGNLTITADADTNGTGAIVDTLADTDLVTAGEQGVNLVTLGSAILSAAQGIGAADDIDTTVTTLEATNSTSNAILIQETDELIIGGTGVRTLAGNGGIGVDVVVGSLTINSVVTAQGSGVVTLTAAQSILIGATVSSTSGNLTLTADSDLNNLGAIVDTLPDTDAGTAGEQGVNLATSGTALLTAAEGIGFVDDIDTDIGTLVATNRAVNSISIQEVNDLIIGGTGVRTLAGAGNITVDVQGDLTVNSVVTADTAGTVLLSADGSVFLGALVSSTTGSLTVIADEDLNAAGAIVDTLADTDAGTAGEQGINLQTSGAAVLTAASGIGSADDIDTAVTFLQATNSTSNSIAIQAVNGLIVNGTGIRTLGGNGNISVDVVAGNLFVNGVVTAHGTGTVLLNAEIGLNDINSAVSSTAGDITVTGNIITQDANITTGGTGRISVRADAGAITMSNGVRTTSGQGNIAYETTAGSIIAEDMLTQGGAIHIDAAGNVFVGNASGARIEATGVIFSSLTVDAAAGTSVLTLSDTTGFSVGQQIFVTDNDSLPQSFIITGTTATTLTLNGLLGSAMTVAQNARVGIQADNPGVATLLTANVGAGSTTVNVQSTAGLSIGQTVTIVDDSFAIGDNSRPESFTITNIAGNQITLNRASTSSYQTSRNAVLTTGQVISVQASGNITVLSGSLLTTDNNPLPGNSEEVTGDRIRLLANGGTGTVAFGPIVSLRTDGGVATTFQQRPDPGGGAGVRSFFNYPATPILAIVSSPDPFTYTAEFTVVVQTPGEENLRLDIDWRDADGDGLVTDRIESFYLQPGMQVLTHDYSFFDLQSFLEDLQGSFLLDFSVSHHESLQVLGGTIQQNGFSSNVNVGPVPGLSFNAGLLTSTDDMTTGQSAPLPTGTVINRSPAVVNSLALSNADFYFEGGTVEIKIPTLLFPPINAPKPTTSPVAEAVAIGAAVYQPLLLLQTSEFESFPLGSFSTQSEDIFRLRRVDATGLFDVPGYEKIREGSNLLHPELLRQWVSEQDLGGASNYELWLITRKRDEDGNEVSVERPLLRFDIVNKRPFPASEDALPDEIPQLILEPVEGGMPVDGMPIEGMPESSEVQPVPDTVPGAKGDAVPKAESEPNAAGESGGEPQDGQGDDAGSGEKTDEAGVSFRLNGTTMMATTAVGMMVSQAIQQGRKRGGSRASGSLTGLVSSVIRQQQLNEKDASGLSESDRLRDSA